MTYPTTVATGSDPTANARVSYPVLFGMLVAAILFQGALRKWALPGISHELFFLKSFAALLFYVYAFRYVRFRFLPAYNGLVFTLLIAMLTLLPMQLADKSPRHIVIVAYGLHNYFLFMPLMVLIGSEEKDNYIKIIEKFFIMCAVLTAPLVIMQYFSPPTSFINAGEMEADAGRSILTIIYGVVRPAGLFTAPGGQTAFVTLALAIVLYKLIDGQKYAECSQYLLCISGASLILIVIFSGSRGLIFKSLFVLAVAAIGPALTGRLRRMFGYVLLAFVMVGAVAMIWAYAFPEVLGNFVQRWENATSHESEALEYGTIQRVFFGFYGFLYYLDNTPIFGHLIGLGGNAARRLSWVHLPEAAQMWSGYGNWAEGAWPRHIIELGPIFGLLMIGLRVMLTFWLFRRCLNHMRGSGEVSSMAVFGACGPELLFGQITSQGTIMSVAWLGAGLCYGVSRR